MSLLKLDPSVGKLTATHDDIRYGKVQYVEIGAATDIWPEVVGDSEDIPADDETNLKMTIRATTMLPVKPTMKMTR